MLKRFLTVSLCLLAITASAQSRKSTKKAPAGPAPDAAFMQKIWDGWATLDPSNVAKYYATGPHVFFDIAPLKYNSWDEYEKGVRNVIAGYKSAKFTVDTPEVHPNGDLVWATAIIKEEMTKIRQGGYGQFPLDRHLGQRRRQLAHRPRARLRPAAIARGSCRDGRSLP
jgi:hypothetical protein